MADPHVHILALDSATRVCEVALLSVHGLQRQRYERSHDGTGEHAETVLPMVDDVLRQADLEREQLTAVAFGQGPGGFTGLRVACGVAQGMAYALGLPVLPVVSLQAMAHAIDGDEAIRVVAQDARMGELYVAAYAQPESAAQGWQSLCEPMLISASDLPVWLARQQQQWGAIDIRLLGNASQAYPELQLLQLPGLVKHAQVLERAPAHAIADLAYLAWLRSEGVSPAQAAPLYVRDKVAFTTAEREQGQGGNPKARPVFEITRMQSSELGAVAEIEKRTQAHPWTVAQFEEAVAAGYEAWVIREADQVLGFYLLMVAPDLVHLLLISVRPESQRRGLGHQLLRHCEARAEQLGVEGVLLEVRPSNRNALDFYANRGFAQVGVRKGYYPNGPLGREDAWVMKKTLKPAGDA
ncbi:tRNA (adenosine(37)-N6)-threonylcarbamoyltransferase complex dimerization subunit type 1 TsaB [Pusillimonas sp. CC-YST705]|uniref:[Ribosomal protein bS18]-alanine N-acetyltransferase n=1 Tax=Mesopusillimonas faecipullorum TaxID=2755040 RepID=A0ABS8C859_9BURK|nr:tRNA (adenosine(37)-N6)-threonylcarbamoyltransferase complex dimerization subunit type 1 TsaB [Mesopusillimonas faecipullorum]